MLDAPVAEAWRHVVNYPAWQNYSLVQHLSGASGQEGEVVLLKKDEGGELPAYLARTVKLDPGRRIIWKVFPPQDSTDCEFFGFIEFRVDAVEGRTRFSYSSLHEFTVPYTDPRELEAYRQRLYANAGAFFAAVLPKLESLVRQGRRATDV